MKIKDYKKQLNESIEVIDVKESVIEYAKGRSYSVSNASLNKKRANGRKIAILVSTFAIVIFASILSIPLIMNGGRKYKAAKDSAKNPSNASENYGVDETKFSPECPSPMEGEPTEASAPDYSPTASSTLEPGTAEAYSDNDIYEEYYNSSNKCYDFDGFIVIYNYFKNGNSLNDFLSNNDFSNLEKEDIEIIYDLAN